MEIQRLWLLLLLLLATVVMATAKPPHIFFIVADDLGWNDVGFRNPYVKTPNIDKLARQGMILNMSYVQPVCSPSRNAFMSGIYPFKVGLQNGVISGNAPACAPLKNNFLPETLRTLGYSTHMVGKWHLGFCNWNCTPTYRGFDSFYGYYFGEEDYYTKRIWNGIDFRDDLKALSNVTDYSPFVYANRVEKIVKAHDASKPLFLYMPFQSVHAPLEVPKSYYDMYPNLNDTHRRTFLGMVTALDDAIGQMIQTFQDKGILEDTLIVFTADNGGQPDYPRGGGNNFPLRGAKTTVFEGGTRGTGFVTGAGINMTGITYNGMIHAVDWYSTLIGAAGGHPDVNVDGMNHWEALQTGQATKRTEFVYNLDDSSETPGTGHAAIRMGDYKLIDGYPGALPDWYYPPEDKHLKEWYPELKEKPQQMKKYTGEGLYNLKDDPTEHVDLSDQYPDVVKQMRARLDSYRKQYVPPYKPQTVPEANPDNYGGFWSPGWCTV